MKKIWLKIWNKINFNKRPKNNKLNNNKKLIFESI